MSWWTGELKLNIGHKCADSRRCSCNPKPANIQVTKDDEVGEAIGFSRYNHELYSGKKFTLLQQLSKDEIVADSNGRGKNVYDVTKVSVYYWNKDENKKHPLLIEVTKQSSEREYYYKHVAEPGRNPNQWAQNTEHHDLQQRLDDRNCAINRATVVDIKNPESTTKIDKSDCRSETRKITKQTVPPPTPPLGGDYTVDEYDIKDNAKISRVTFDGNPTNINLDTIEFAKIRVYYWEADDIGIPLLVEFKPSAPKGTSVWFENTHKQSTKWEYISNTTDFYDTEIPPKPTWKLTSKLDQVNCTLNNVVQIDVSKTPQSGGGSYCHGISDRHKSTKIKVTLTSKRELYLYRSLEHKFYNGNPFDVSSFKNGEEYLKHRGLPTLLRDVNRVVVYFCRDNVGGTSAENPLLIYIDAKTLPDINRWFQSKDGGTSWQTVDLTMGENEHEKIVDILDKLTSNCAPPEVTIKINERDPSSQTHSYKDPPQGDKQKTIKVEKKDHRDDALNGFTEYMHTVCERPGTYFTIGSFTYGDKGIGKLQTPMYKVGSVSVFYWTQLENGRREDQRGRPLLIKVIIKNVTNDQTTVHWYENVGDPGNKNWNTVTEPSPPTELSSDDKLKKKLYLLNCRLNNAVIIDVNEKPGPDDHVAKDYDKCSSKDIRTLDSQHGSQRMTVEKDGNYGTTLKHYKVYTHKLKNATNEKFHIVDFEGGIPKSLVNTPILDVSDLKVYMCKEDPLLVYYQRVYEGYYGRHTYHNWFKKDGSWQKERTLSDQPHTEHEKILQVLDEIESECGPPSVTIDLSEGVNEQSHEYTDTTAKPSKQTINVEKKTEDKDGNDPPLNYDRYDHTVASRPGSYFKLEKVVYGGDSHVISQIKKEEAATLVSVYYWKHGEDVGGKPLLVRVEFRQQKSNPSIKSYAWYENTGTGNNNTEWKKVDEPDDPERLKEDKLKKKLDLLNCRLNNVVVVDASKKGESYCHKEYPEYDIQTLDKEHPSKLNVVEDNASMNKKLATYKAYEHSTTSGDFHIVGMKNTGGTSITLDSKGTPGKPILNVRKVIFYFCPLKAAGKPLLIYYKNDSGNNWYNSDDGDTWETLADWTDKDPGVDSSCLAIIDKLDEIDLSRNPCRPTEVIIDIMNGPNGTNAYTGVNVTPAPVSTAPNYTEYKHKPMEMRERKYFTITQVNYKNQMIDQISPPIGKVKLFSVYYWTPLGDKGNPLLIKIVKLGSEETLWYENTGQNNNNIEWSTIGNPSSLSESAELKKKLDLLNCHLNNVTVIDFGKKPADSPYCHDNDRDVEESHDPKLIKVTDVTKNLYQKKLGSFVVYQHSLTEEASKKSLPLDKKFHISGFTNKDGTVKIKDDDPPLPFFNITKFLVFWCSDTDKGEPLLFYVEYSKDPSGGESTDDWFKREKKDSDEWVRLTDATGRPKTTDTLADIYTIINEFDTPCKNNALLYILTGTASGGATGGVGYGIYKVIEWFFMAPWPRLM